MEKWVELLASAEKGAQNGIRPKAKSPPGDKRAPGTPRILLTAGLPGSRHRRATLLLP